MNGFRTRAREIFRQKGIFGLTRGVIRWIYWRLRRLADPVYQIAKPSTRTFNIGPASATFDMSETSLVRHDFRADLRSERKVIQRLIEAVDPEDIFFDVGANVGIYSLLITDVLHSGSVVAFEPHPDRVAMLRQNANLNGDDIQICQAALSDETGEMDMVSSGSTRHHLAWEENTGTITIETVQGDNLVNEGAVPSPDVIKIDVEGAEMMALRGLDQTLSNGACRTVFCEIHPDELEAFGESPDSPESFLRQRGYEVQRIDDRKKNYFIEATR
jgi:FkbM family methyltransferase